METFALSIRAVVLCGAVLFSFTLMIAGFYLVLREYKLIRTFGNLKDFIQLTKDATFEADLAKRTISLSRTRPGLIMIGIGAALLMACIWTPLKIETESGIQPRKLKSADESRNTSSSKARSDYEKWLDQTPVISQLSLEDQGKVLAAVTPNSGIGQRTFLTLDGDTLDAIASGVYGNAQFTPLVRAFNPNLTTYSNRIPTGTPIHVWLIGSSADVPQFMIRKVIKLSGESPKAAYSQIFPYVDKIAGNSEFKANPDTFINRVPGGIMGFLDGLRTLTGDPWTLQYLTPENGDTAETFARAIYGAKEFYPFFLLSNTHDQELFQTIQAKTNALPTDKPMAVIRLSRKD